MSRQRFYIGKKEPDDFAGDLEEWIDDKIPLPASGQVCECTVRACHTDDDQDGDEKCLRPAESYLYRIKDGHVCYTYVCYPCGEHNGAEDYLADYEYPTTGDGYAIVPAHCVE